MVCMAPVSHVLTYCSHNKPKQTKKITCQIFNIHNTISSLQINKSVLHIFQYWLVQVHCWFNITFQRWLTDTKQPCQVTKTLKDNIKSNTYGWIGKNCIFFIVFFFSICVNKYIYNHERYWHGHVKLGLTTEDRHQTAWDNESFRKQFYFFKFFLLNCCFHAES